MHALSVVIITKNEESTIDRCLSSLKWADEIIVLDGFSTDKTVEICRKYTDKIYQKKFVSFPVEREYALGKASNDWVLSVDADMYFPPQFCQEIRNILSADVIPFDGFYAKGLTIFLGREIRHCGWYDHSYMRFFNKTKGRYDTKTYTVLDIFYVFGPKGKLKNHFVHYTKETFLDYFGKIRRISDLTAYEYKNKGLKLSRYNIILFMLLKPGLIFLYKYIYKLGFLDGAVGLVVSINSAISYYVAYAALWDMERKNQEIVRNVKRNKLKSGYLERSS